MRYILTLNKINRTDFEKIGFRAIDFAILKEKEFILPLSFVISNEAYEDFLAENGLKAKVDKIMEEKPDVDEAYHQIMESYVKANLSKELQAELLEAYESLAIEPGSNAHGIISSFDAPFINLIRSPTYILNHEDEDGIIQNIKGKDNFFIAIKLIWASLFSPSSIEYRKKSGISDNFTTGVIVSKEILSRASAITYSRTEYNEYMIRVKSFFGLLDYAEPTLGKDIHEVDVNSLLIRSSQVNPQEYEIICDLVKEELVKRRLLEGSKQKLNEKLICEIARLTKRSKATIGKDVKLYFAVNEDAITLLQVNRLVYQEQKEVASQETITIVEDEKGKTINTITENVVVKTEEPTFTLPGLLSLDEAKEEVAKSQGHRIFSLDGFEEQKEEPVISEIKTEITEPKIEEVNIVEEVLRMKRILDKMEESALEKNNDSYEENARKLKSLLERIK